MKPGLRGVQHRGNNVGVGVALSLPSDGAPAPSALSASKHSLSSSLMQQTSIRAKCAPRGVSTSVIAATARANVGNAALSAGLSSVHSAASATPASCVVPAN